MGRSILLHLFLITTGILDITSGQGENSPPIWDAASVQILTFGYPEDTKIGEVLTQLRCTDPDGDPVNYRLESGQVVGVTSDGKVILAQPLDYEKVEAVGYDVSFSCYDVDSIIGFRLHDPVTINGVLSVDDSNDNAPKFTTRNPDGYTYDISEDSPVSTILLPRITISDDDISINAAMEEVSMICNSKNATLVATLPETSIESCLKFSLTYELVKEGNYIATITLNDELDYETRRIYSTKIYAIDIGSKNDSLSSTINLQINVLDAQDRDPIFTNPGSTTSVSEGAQKGDVLAFAISARDGDLGDGRPVVIEIIEDERDAFYLGESTLTSTPGIYAANLIVNNSIDRESIVGSYPFTVKVTELNATTREKTSATATATYSVSISDINDETPEFENSLYNMFVTELVDITESVQITGLRIVCIDKDEPSNAAFRVRIVNQTFPDVFSISPDTEFVVQANLVLQVDKPAFVDYDVENYRRQVVNLEATEVKTAFPKSSTTRVIINLLDLNDNSPDFTQPSYARTISEYQPTIPSGILTLTATDKDSGANGEIFYSLEDSTSSTFSINSETGALTLVRPLDYEEVNQYVFLVYATDKATQGAKSSQVQVTITISNYNDLAPVFQQASYQTSINEGALRFLTPVTVRAIDTEDGTIRITYRLVSGQSLNEAFVLNSRTGELTINKALRYEETVKDGNNQPTGRFNLVVEASDNVDPPQTSNIDVTVFLIDQNNYPPVLNPVNYYANLSELASPGDFVAEIKGTDQDNGDFGRITYRLESGGYDNFVVDPVTGIVRVNDPQNFDYNQQKFYTVRIKASDGGSPQKTAIATVSVDIHDDNNKAPKFEKSIYTGTVNEKSPTGFTIFQVFATDSDSSKDLRFRVLKDTIAARDGDGNILTADSTYDYQNAISVNAETGDVFVNSVLDKETALEINFQIQVEDIAAQTQNQVDKTQVSLTVTGEIDDNINFDVVSQNFMNEDTAVFFPVATLVASDPINPQDSLTFSKLSDIPEFDVTRSGIVRLARKIDYEEDKRVYRVTVKAVAADGLRSATATVTINVLDVNDNAPEFDRPIYQADVDEDAAFPELVTTIRATDKDSPSYGPIAYRIGGGVSSSDFQLYDAGGDTVFVLVAKGRTLDYNQQRRYELDVFATDNPYRTVASNQNFASVKLIINVIDKNNNIPTFKFQETFRRMAIAETASLQKNVGTVIATDADFGPNGEISYFLQAIPNDPDSVRGLELFRMIEELGTIVVNQPLVGLGGKRYPMIVRATDHGDPPNSASLTMQIEVLSTEVDDGSPLWIVPSEDYSVHVLEEKAGVVINANFFQVTPRTGDTVYFSLTPLTTYGDRFKIDNITGEITMTEPLDREARQSYTLVVVARDKADPDNIRSARQITVHLNDINDNIASFKNPRGYPQCGEPIDGVVDVFVDENVQANQTIYKVAACDPDATGNNEIIYLFYDETPECAKNNNDSGIEVRSDGSLMTTRVIDYEQDHEYNLCIRARSVNPAVNQTPEPLSDVIFLRIEVRDQNDNGPKFPEKSIIAVMNIRPSVLETVVWLAAVDLDGIGYSNVKYTITSVVFHEGGQSRRVDDLFVIKSSYAVSPSRTSYERYYRGYFLMEVLATDSVNPELQDTVTVKIYLYRPGQAIKVILNKPPTEGYSKANPLTDELNAAAKEDGFRLVFLQASEHSSDGSVDLQKTDICFLGIDTNNNEMTDKSTLIRLLEDSSYGDILTKDDYETVERGACYPSKSSEESIKWRRLWWVLVAVAIFIFVCCLIFILLICILYERYKRYMKSKQMYMVPQ